MQMKNRMLFCALTAVVVLSCAVAVQTAIAEKSSAAAFVSLSDSKMAALTFDTALSETDYTEEILDVLKQKRTKATFAVCGIWAEEHTDTLMRIISEGHEVISHTMYHEDYSKMSAEDILQDASEARELLAQAGADTQKIRPAYPPGNEAEETLRSAGYTLTGYTVDSKDWKTDEDAAVEKQVLSEIKEGSIVLFQTDEEVTVRVLADIIDAMKVRSYDPVTRGGLGV